MQKAKIQKITNIAHIRTTNALKEALLLQYAVKIRLQLDKQQANGALHQLLSGQGTTQRQSD